MKRIAALFACLLATGGAKAAPLPIAAYLSEVAIQDPIVAPDGSAIAFMSLHDRHRTIRVLPRGNGPSIDTSAGSADLDALEWIDSRHLGLFTRTFVDASAVSPNQIGQQLVSFRLSDRNTALILARTPNVAPLVAGGTLQYGRRDGKPSVFLRGLSAGPSFSLYSADADTGLGTLLDKGSFDAEEWAVSSDGRVLAAKQLDPMQRTSRLLVHDWDERRLVTLPEADEPFSLQGMGLHKDTFAVIQDGRLYEVTASGAVSKSLAPEGAQVTAVIHRNDTGLLVAAKVAGAAERVVFFDPDLARAYEQAIKPFHGAMTNFVASDDAYRELIIRTEGPTDAGSYYWVHLSLGTAELIGHARPMLDGQPLGVVRPLSFKAQDGLEITGRVTLPPDGALTALPAVVLVHDLGIAAPSPGFDAEAQALASRGYAVIEVNYRGTIGAGAAAQAAGRGELGFRMQTDVSDAVHHLVEAGLVDTKRVCIAGSGYGGYAALSGVIFQRGFYSCAIAINPVADFGPMTVYPDSNQRGARWDSTQLWRRALGEERLDRDSLAGLSPIRHAAAASAPILIIYDDLDDDFHKDNAERMGQALQRAGKPVAIIRRDLKTNALGLRQDRSDILSDMIEFLGR
ncbi:S9 family peptidase [Caulobacter sp. S45]|uniref:alpha/beta hydrolase family protein n=1 Tax=Caulobacter sp. S45 TaxID=1641861 RepID=UPI00131D7EAE|nr:prolyl oligopeptidase family serine peptidase [Caulobacter sp. S45]